MIYFPLILHFSIVTFQHFTLPLFLKSSYITFYNPYSVIYVIYFHTIFTIISLTYPHTILSSHCHYNPQAGWSSTPSLFLAPLSTVTPHRHRTKQPCPQRSGQGLKDTEVRLKRGRDIIKGVFSMLVRKEWENWCQFGGVEI